MSVIWEDVKEGLGLGWGVTLVGVIKKTVCAEAFMIRSLPGKLWVAASGLNRKEAVWSEQVDEVRADPPRTHLSGPPLLPPSFTHATGFPFLLGHWFSAGVIRHPRPRDIWQCLETF